MSQKVKNLPTIRRHVFDPWVGKIPKGENSNSLWYSCLKNPMDKRNLAGYNPKDGKELDTTE